MKDLHHEPTDDAGEVRLPPDMIIASATDTRGIIRYANPQFCEISGFEIEALIGAPHKVVRHPDMPKAVFWLFWDRLKRGLPVCAYVKNRTASDGFYWVLAVVTATPDGYLSVRIRPEAEIFEQVRSLYADLRRREAQALSPEQSAAALLDALKDMGFADYDAFMQAALVEEYGLRGADATQAGEVIPKLVHLSQLLGAAETLADQVGRDFVKVRSEPVNMRILAGRLEGASGALGTISQNYDIMASEMQHLVEKLRCRDSGALGRMRTALDQGRFKAQIAALMTTAAAQRDADGATRLADQADLLLRASQRSMADISASARAIPEICRQLRHRINGLNVVKLLCRVESGRMQNSDTGLEGIIERLERFHDDTEKNLATLSSKADQIKTNSTMF